MPLSGDINYGAFLQGTLIKRIDEQEIPIENIKKDDLLYGVGPDGNTSISQVVTIAKSKLNEYLKITTEDTILNVGPNQRIYVGPDVPSDKECPHFSRAKTIKPNDLLYHYGKKSKVLSIEIIHEQQELFNLKCERPGIEPTHETEDCWATFHANGIAVHEMGACPPCEITNVSPSCGGPGTFITINCDGALTTFDGGDCGPAAITAIAFNSPASGSVPALSWTQVNSTTATAVAPLFIGTAEVVVSLSGSVINSQPASPDSADFTGCNCGTNVSVQVFDPFFASCGQGLIYNLTQTGPDSWFQSIDFPGNSCGILSASWQPDFIVNSGTGLFFVNNGEEHFEYTIADPDSTCNEIVLYHDMGGDVPDYTKYAIITMCPACGGDGGGFFGFGNNFPFHQRHDTGGPHSSGPPVSGPRGTTGTIPHSSPLNQWTTTKGIGMRRKYILGAAMLEPPPCSQWAFVGAPSACEAMRTNDGDTSYAYSNVFGDIQLCTKAPTPPCPEGPTIIQQVIQEFVARKDDSGPRSAVPVLKIDGTIYYGNNVTLTTSYQTFDYVWLVNPATGLPWTLVDVNNLEFGVEVT